MADRRRLRSGKAGSSPEPEIDARRRALLKASGILGACTAVAPLLAAAPASAAAPAKKASRAARRPAPFPYADGKKVHVVESTEKSTRLGVFDTTLPNLVEIESGDTVVYKDMWSHFLNRLQPGVPIEDIARWRKENPGKGPHTIVGPVAVRGAAPGDVLEIQYHRVLPKPWGVNFNNPGALGTGALPDAFPDGQVKYFKFDLARMTVPFSDRIQLPLAPFEGTLGLAPPDGFAGVTNGVYSSVPPGPHAGNLDIAELGEGSRIFIPVWQPGGRIFTGDSHAVQGDGEVNLCAIETALQELRIRVFLHKNAGLRWPFGETATHWIPIGLDKDLQAAFRLCLENSIEFLNRKAGLTRLDAYALCSAGVSFRISQVVDVNKGVHAMIPKSIFARRLAEKISVA